MPGCSAAAAAWRVDRDGDRLGRAGDRPLRVLEAVAGDRADDGRARPAAVRRRRSCSSPATLAADAGSTNTASLRAHSRYASRICRSVTASISPPDSSRAASASVHDAGLPIRIAVAMVIGAATGAPLTIGAAPAAWNPNMRGVVVDDAVRGVLAVAPPVRGDVAGVADRDAVDVGGAAERVADLERRGLLALDPERVDRVDQRDRVVDGQLLREFEAVVEVAVDLQQLGAVHERLRELAERDLALRARARRRSCPARTA